jgi:hypothetical protein
MGSGSSRLRCLFAVGHKNSRLVLTLQIDSMIPGASLPDSPILSKRSDNDQAIHPEERTAQAG